MNDVELWKRLDAMHETFKSIARSLETMAHPLYKVSDLEEITCDKIKKLDKITPGWRDMKHDNV